MNKTSGPVGNGWIEEVKTGDGTRFVAQWKIYVTKDGVTKRVRGGSYELGPRVKVGPPGSLRGMRDAEKKWSQICDSVIGRTPDLHPTLMTEQTFEWFARNIFEAERKDAWEPASKSSFEYYMAKILPVFGATKLRDMRKATMQRFLNGLAETYSHSVVDHSRKYLRAILQRAFEKRAVDENEALHLEMPETREVKRPYLSIDAYGKLLDAMPTNRDRLIARILFLCALRRREVFALHPRDFDGESLSIERQVVEATFDEGKTNYRGRGTKKLKTSASRAKVVVPEELRRHFHEYLQTDNFCVQQWLFPNKFKTGPVHSKNWLDRVLKPAALRAEIGRIDFHSFRRGAATEMHQLGEVDANIQGQLRHSSPDVTRKVYIQGVRSGQITAVGNLETAAGRKKA